MLIQAGYPGDTDELTGVSCVMKRGETMYWMRSRLRHGNMGYEKSELGLADDYRQTCSYLQRFGQTIASRSFTRRSYTSTSGDGPTGYRFRSILGRNNRQDMIHPLSVLKHVMQRWQ